MCSQDTYIGPLGVAGISIEHFDKGAIRITSILSVTLDEMILIWSWREQK